MRALPLLVISLSLLACAGGSGAPAAEESQAIAPPIETKSSSAAASDPPVQSAVPIDAMPLESVRPGVNDKFLDPDLDVDEWKKRFEGESREVYAARAKIVGHLGIRSGMTVADIGAGTGAFLPSFAKAVGESGAVFAVDISPNFLEHLRDRVAKEKLQRVRVVAGTDRSVELPPDKVDLVFICDTYHHFEYPSATLASIREALVPGGVLILVDFERIPGTTSQWILDHVRADKATFTAEIEAAGFRLDGELDVKELKENYALRFVRA